MAKKKQPIIAPQPVADKTAAPQAPQYNGNVPVQPASAQMQLAPIVQPIAFVPYSTMQQPLYQYEQAYNDVSNDFYGRNDQFAPQRQPIAPEADEQAVADAPVKKARFVPIFVAILSLLTLVVLILGQFVSAIAEYTTILDGQVGYKIVYDAFLGGAITFDATIITPACVALIAVFALLNFITCLCTMMKKGVCVFSKICLFFMLAFSLVIIISSVIAKNVASMGYGLYAVGGLSLISFLFGYLAKRA